MKYPWFKVGFATTIGIFSIVNIVDYFRARAEYYKFLEESGWVWAGHWTWGLPFTMVIEGLGTEGEKYSVVASSAVFNIIFCLILAGLVGICAEYLRGKLYPEAA